MPAVRATDDEVWKMVAFVKRLGSAGLREKAPGDAVAGKAVYEGREVRDVPLDRPRWRKPGSRPERRRPAAQPEYLEESLVKPDADVPIRYRAVRW